jgi:hypothetical protein
MASTMVKWPMLKCYLNHSLTSKSAHIPANPEPSDPLLKAPKKEKESMVLLKN